jgi:hypothetical protein
MSDAGRLADRVSDLCARGESVDDTVARLQQRVGQIEALVAAGGGELSHSAGSAVRELSARVYTATAAIEAKKSAVAAELQAVAQRDRVQRVYTRTPG